MFNLIRNDIIKIMKKEINNMFKYIVIFLVLYLAFNDISYSGVSILVSYIIITNTFYNNENREDMQYISIVTKNREDIVYSRYILTVSIIMVLNLISVTIIYISSNFIFRGMVFNDVLFSMNIFLIIMSLVLPMFFKYGYHKSRILSATLSIVVYCVVGSFINMFNDRVYETNYFDIYKELIVLNDYSGPFSSMMKKLVYEINIKFLEFYTITIITIVLFIFSMYISVRIVRRNKYLIK